MTAKTMLVEEAVNGEAGKLTTKPKDLWSALDSSTPITIERGFMKELEGHPGAFKFDTAIQAKLKKFDWNWIYAPTIVKEITEHNKRMKKSKSGWDKCQVCQQELRAQDDPRGGNDGGDWHRARHLAGK